MFVVRSHYAQFNFEGLEFIDGERLYQVLKVIEQKGWRFSHIAHGLFCFVGYRSLSDHGLEASNLLAAIDSIDRDFENQCAVIAVATMLSVQMHTTFLRSSFLLFDQNHNSSEENYLKVAAGSKMIPIPKNFFRSEVVLARLEERMDASIAIGSALSSGNARSRLVACVKVFEIGFSCGGGGLKPLLAEFLASGPLKVRKETSDLWINSRHKISHGKKIGDMVFESDVVLDSKLFTLAAYDVLFHKANWRKPDAKRVENTLFDWTIDESFATAAHSGEAIMDFRLPSTDAFGKFFRQSNIWFGIDEANSAVILDIRRLGYDLGCKDDFICQDPWNSERLYEYFPDDGKLFQGSNKSVPLLVCPPRKKDPRVEQIL